MIVIGDTVRSLNPSGQVKVPGTVVGLIRADFYVDIMLNMGGKRNPPIDPDFIWSRVDPDWRHSLVALVFFNEPHRTATLAEWVEDGVNKGLTREECEASYEKDCPITQSMVLPVNDLMVVG